MHAVPTPATISRLATDTVATQLWVGNRHGWYCDPGSQLDFCGFGLRCVNAWTGTPGPTHICCGPREIGCRGNCRRECPMGTRLTSACMCCAGCRGLGQIQDPTTCDCDCPDDTILCDNECVDPLTDNRHCGRCNNPCIFQPFEKCCAGKCRELGTVTDCRDCDDRLPAGFCCGPGEQTSGWPPQPTPLGTDADCRDCGDACTGGQVCVPGAGGVFQCECPSTREPCTTEPGLKCCPAGLRCCAWGCESPAGILCGTTGAACSGQPGWAQWRASHLTTPVRNCATGACDPSLEVVSLGPGLGSGCCPPSFTRVVNGLCKCPPDRPRIVNGVCSA
jgi:hypothetical protein